MEWSRNAIHTLSYSNWPRGLHGLPAITSPPDHMLCSKLFRDQRHIGDNLNMTKNSCNADAKEHICQCAVDVMFCLVCCVFEMRIANTCGHWGLWLKYSLWTRRTQSRVMGHNTQQGLTWFLCSARPPVARGEIKSDRTELIGCVAEMWRLWFAEVIIKMSGRVGIVTCYSRYCTHCTCSLWNTMILRNIKHNLKLTSEILAT